jgi:hypothetical protein
MKNPRPFTNSSSSPSFALISVLALVSLAALTATAFLASARLERQATMPLTQTTMLDMALDSGAVAALRLLESSGAEQFNHVVTYWRGSGANDWTNELGYLLIGSHLKGDIGTPNSRKVKFYFCFSSAALTNLGTNLIEYTNQHSAGDQAQFTRRIKQVLEPTNASTRTGTNFANDQFTNIPLLGDIPIPANGPNRFTSPPVGWVYINQDVRVKPGQTNTTNVPATRFAFYVQDLSSMIDADRMGGFTNGTPYRESTALPANYTQGTNPAEISLTNLTGTVLTNSNTAASFTSTNNRAKYLSPGMLVLSNGGRLNTNNLRYVTTGLRHWTNAYERIPFGLGYSNCGTSDKGTNKYCLEPVSSLTVDKIRNHITSNCPPFATNGTSGRAGGMNGSAYVTALAANIIDYADTDSSATSTTTNGVNIVGFDSYPFVTQIFDQFVCTQTGTAPPVITVNTYIQFWNPSSFSSPATNYTLLYDFADTVHTVVFTNASSTNSNVVTTRMFPTNSAYTNSVGTVHSFSNNISLPLLLANQGTIVSFPITYPLNLSGAPPAGFDWANFSKVWINDTSGSTQTNPFTLRNGTNDLSRPKTSFYRSAISLTNGETNWLGAIPGLRYGASTIGAAGQSRLCADPRMLNYLTSNPTTNGSAVSYANTFWGGYPAETTSANIWGNPGLWPDGTNSTEVCPSRGTNYAATSTPPLGVFTISDPAPCKISNFGSYTNICELGNVFDPIQWEPPIVTTNYANCNISTNWTTNRLYGGGSTLRIGRPEHSRFAWTKPSGATTSDPSIPNMQMSAAALLDLFCTTNQFDEGGKINLNTAPAPVLRALAGGIYLRSDTNLLPGGTNFSVPSAMAEAFAQGVMRFRNKYPFYSPSQLAFIGTDPGWPNTNSWPSGAVFGNKDSIFLNSSAPGNSSGASATMGVTAWNDQAAEEWFSKIFKLSTVYSRNFRVYVIAQKATTNSAGVYIGIGPVVRKYYNLLIRERGVDADSDPGASPVTTFQSYY